MRKPTIHDVAARAGVSKSTVSLALQNSPLVRAAKRAAVQQAIVDLGYVYNAAAAGMRTKTAPLPLPAAGAGIALVTDLADPDSAAFTAALQKAAMAHGLALNILPQGAPYKGRRITTLPDDPAHILTLTALHPRAFARVQDGLVAGQATRHLLGLGAASVAFVGGDLEIEADALRIRGYMKRMTKAELPPLHLPNGDDKRDDYAFGRHAFHTLRAQHPTCTAALCINDQVALGIMGALAEAGMAIGDGFRVVGWGDTAAAQRAGLSSVRPAWDALANACLTWALLGGTQHLEVAPTLVRRASSMGGA